MTPGLVYISYAFEMFGLNFKRNRTVYEKQSRFQHCQRMRGHLLCVAFSAEALGWLILSFLWLPCLPQLSLTEPFLCARVELDSPFQRGFGSEFTSPALREQQTGRSFWDTSRTVASRALETEELYYKRRAVICGEEEVGLGGTVNAVSLPRAFTYSLFARLPLRQLLAKFLTNLSNWAGWGWV